MTSGLGAGIKIRPSKKDLDDIGVDFRDRWLEYYAPAPDKPVLWIATLAVYASISTSVLTRMAHGYL